MSTRVHVHPCAGVPKTVLTSYFCGTRINIACSSNTVVQIQRVLYGRDDTTTCLDPNTGCGSNSPCPTTCNWEGATAVLTDWCTGSTACHYALSAFERTSTYTDPCRGTMKFARVWYACVATSSVSPASAAPPSPTAAPPPATPYAWPGWDRGAYEQALEESSNEGSSEFSGGEHSNDGGDGEGSNEQSWEESSQFEHSSEEGEHVCVCMCVLLSEGGASQSCASSLCPRH